MGIVNENAGIIFFGQFYQGRKVNNFTGDGKYSIRDDETASRLGDGLKHALQIFHVVVVVACQVGSCSERHDGCCHKACVVVAVGDNVFAALHQCRDDTLSGLVASAEEQTALFFKKISKLLFKLDVEVDCAGHVARSAATGAVFINGVD